MLFVANYVWKSKKLFSICKFHLLSMWPCSECSIRESSTLLLGSLVESEVEGDAVWEFSGLSKLQFRLINYLHFDIEVLAYQFYSSWQRNW